MAARLAADTYSFKRPALHRAGSVYTHTQSLNTMKTTASSIKNIDHVRDGQYGVVKLRLARMEKYNPEVLTHVEPMNSFSEFRDLDYEQFKFDAVTSYHVAERRGATMVCPISGRDYGEYPSYR